MFYILYMELLLKVEYPNFENSTINICKIVNKFLKDNENKIIVRTCGSPTFSDRQYEKHRTYINSACSHSRETMKINYSFSFELTNYLFRDEDNDKALKWVKQLINPRKTPIEDICFYERKIDKEEDLLKIDIPLPLIVPFNFEKPRIFDLSLKIGNQTCWVNGKQVSNEKYYRVCEDSERFWNEHPTFVY